MKMSDLDKNILTEAPVSLISRAGSKLKSYVPGDIGARAEGELSTAREANRIKRAYSRELGKTGEQIDAKSLRGFLDNAGLLNTRISREITRADKSFGIDKAVADKVILMATQDYVKSLSGPSQSSTPPATNTSSTPPASSTSTTSSSSTTPPAAAPSTPPTAGTLSLADIEAATTALTAREKKALLKSLVSIL
jgi:hypothetical protein